jgi:hypothetical protein
MAVVECALCHHRWQASGSPGECRVCGNVGHMEEVKKPAESKPSQTTDNKDWVLCGNATCPFVAVGAHEHENLHLMFGMW